MTKRSKLTCSTDSAARITSDPATRENRKFTYEELERYRQAAEHVDAIQVRAIRDFRSALCALKLSKIEHVWLCQDCGKRRNENGE